MHEARASATRIAAERARDFTQDFFLTAGEIVEAKWFVMIHDISPC